MMQNELLSVLEELKAINIEENNLLSLIYEELYNDSEDCETILYVNNLYEKYKAYIDKKYNKGIFEAINHYEGRKEK